MRFFLLFFLILGLISCNKRKENIEIIKIETDTTKYHFPIGTFGDSLSYIDTLTNNWYSGVLRALEEPVLYNTITTKEIYRYTWLRTFHNPVSIRIEKDGEEYQLIWKLCNGKSGYKPGALTINKSKKISISEWNQFLTLLEKSNFWEMETSEEIMGMDGSQWILEAKIKNKYHVTDRWSPMDRDSAYTACGNFLVKLTDLSIEKRFNY